jgi:hypothetical protein
MGTEPVDPRVSIVAALECGEQPETRFTRETWLDDGEVRVVLRRWLGRLVEQRDLGAKERHAIPRVAHLLQRAPDRFIAAKDPFAVALLVEQKLARPWGIRPGGATRPDAVNRRVEGTPVPGLERASGRGVMEVPGMQVVKEGDLIRSEESDVEIIVTARLAVEEEIQGPPATDPPRPGEASQEVRHLLGMDGLPRPQIGVITRVWHSPPWSQPEVPQRGWTVHARRAGHRPQRRLRKSARRSPPVSHRTRGSSAAARHVGCRCSSL